MSSKKKSNDSKSSKEELFFQDLISKHIKYDLPKPVCETNNNDSNTNTSPSQTVNLGVNTALEQNECSADIDVTRLEDKLLTNCSIQGCKRKPKGDCANGMCLKCCIEQKTDDPHFCQRHLSARLKKSEEDKLLQEGIASAKKRKFYHYDERFTSSQQTVLVWCSNDFYRCKRHSEDTFMQLLKQERQEMSRMKRELARSQNQK